MGKKNKNIYDQVCEFENIWLASKKARRGKRTKLQTSEFEYDLEKNLFEIRELLINEDYKFGRYNEFKVNEPKERLICAAPYKDRVVHHALCNIIEPILDKAMIYDSYACRKGKGSHLAIKRAQTFLRSSNWVLKIDLKKYFFTIDHEILVDNIHRKIQDKKIINLIKQILQTYKSNQEYYFYFDNDGLFDTVRNRGLPIGNLTSQLFANFYLNDFDRFIKEELKFKKYLRYMDDLLIFSENKSNLIDAKKEFVMFLNKKRLKLNDRKTNIFPVSNGISFLGFHLYEYYSKILRQNLQRFKKRMKKYSYQYENGFMEFKNILLSLNSYLGFADKKIYGDYFEFNKI